MISIELIRNDPGLVRETMRKRVEDVPIDRILDLDVRRRSAIVESDTLRARRNDVSKQLSQMKERPPELIDEMREVGAKIRGFDEELRVIGAELDSLLLTVPNLLDDEVPLGEDAPCNGVGRTERNYPS